MARRPSFWPNPHLLELLRHLHLRSRVRSLLWSEGRRRGGRYGPSMEIADFRPYVQGDDYRYLDWNAYARFDQLVVRLFQSRRALPVTVVLDTSASMDFGQPGKFDFARSLAAVLGLLALRHLDQLSVWTGPTTTTPSMKSRTFSGIRSLAMLKAHLSGLEPRERMDLPAEMNRIAAGVTHGGKFIVLSDFLPPADWTQPLRRLAAAGQEPLLVQILSPQEWRPEFTGPLRLRDPESARTLRLTPDRTALTHYQQRLAAYRDQLAAQARAGGGDYLFTSTAVALEDLLARWEK